MPENKSDNKTLDLRNEKIQKIEKQVKSEHRLEFEKRIERIDNKKKAKIKEDELRIKNHPSSEYKQESIIKKEESKKNEPIVDLSEKKPVKKEDDIVKKEIVAEKKKSSLKEELKNKEESTKEFTEEKSVKRIKKNIFFDGNFSNIPNEIGKIEFPKDFLWGTSTSAYQVGGGIDNNWSVWEKSDKRKEKLKKEKKKVADYICGDAVDSYHKWKEDLDAAKDLNTNAIRLGLSWARIQPQKDTWDVGVLDHYRKVLEGAQKRGLKTVVTLWHWTNPLWLTEEKGWENKNSIEHFKEYTKMIVEEFGGLVDFWITLNEPMVPIVNGYVNGKFPPNKKLAFKKVGKVFKNLYKAHIASYKIIHDYFPDSQVSITNLTNYFEPARKWLIPEVFLVKLFAYFSNVWFLNKIKKHIDYIGVDYYFHDRIVMYPPFKKNANVFTTDLHWEIFPKGIYHVLKDLKKYNLPIYIMENGLADKEDRYRAQFIKEHLYWTWKAMKEGSDVKGYFHWSLLDNFEWDKGFGPKFGLYAVDRKTLERKKRESAVVYGEICESNSVNF